VDHGQKIFPLARGDSVLAFAGETFFAYPLILQTLRYIDDYDRAEYAVLWPTKSDTGARVTLFGKVL